MRSRYCAYALGLVDYIVETTEPDSPAWDPSPSWRDDIARFCTNTRFLRLEILDAPAPDGAVGAVVFRASLEQGGQPASFTERSRFVQRGGRWRYHSGDRLDG